MRTDDLIWSESFQPLLDWSSKWTPNSHRLGTPVRFSCWYGLASQTTAVVWIALVSRTILVTSEKQSLPSDGNGELNEKQTDRFSLALQAVSAFRH